MRQRGHDGGAGQGRRPCPRVAYNYYSDVVAGIAMGYRKQDETNGFAKIITNQEGRLLGAYVIGPQAAVLCSPLPI